MRIYFDQHGAELKLEGHLAKRSKLFAERLVAKLEKFGKPAEAARSVVKAVLEGASFKTEEDKNDEGNAETKTSVLLFMGEDELESIKDAMLAHWSEITDTMGSSASVTDAAPKEGEAKASKSTRKSNKDAKKDKSARGSSENDAL